MKQLTLDLDAAIISLWRTGSNLSDISAATGIDEMRLVGHVNRLVNAATLDIDFSAYRNVIWRES